MIEEAIDLSIKYLAQGGALVFFYLWSQLLIKCIWVNPKKQIHKTKIVIFITVIICLVWSAISGAVIGLMMNEKITGLSIFFTGIVISLLTSYNLYTNKGTSKE